MHDVHGAIDALKVIAGLPDLALDQNGHNDLGAATGAARLALDPARGAVS